MALTVHAVYGTYIARFCVPGGVIFVPGYHSFSVLFVTAAPFLLSGIESSVVVIEDVIVLWDQKQTEI